MRTFLKLFIATLTVLLFAAAGGAWWYVHTKQPVRSGSLALARLKGPVSVAFDERGVPHIQADHEVDLYRALGYLHAQDRWFQMEMVRRLARGELAEVLGPKLLSTDKLFRTLGLAAHAETMAQRLDPNSPAGAALQAYLDGVNQVVSSRPVPLEFDVLGIPRRPFTVQDTFAVTGYLAYSFAAAFKTEPALTFIRDQLGTDYLKVFDLDWHPEGVLEPLALGRTELLQLAQLGRLGDEALHAAGVPAFEGSNAWAIGGARTTSGKPLLAGDPHIAYSAPAVWYEAHLIAPGFELFGHHQALNPVALLGHNRDFGWSLTMFQNDDLDLVALKTNAAGQVLVRDQWVGLGSRNETIKVKGAASVPLTVRLSPYGPIINDIFPDNYGKVPVAMWWAFLQTPNPVLEAFYELNRAPTLAAARTAVEKIHAPGLNVVWANARGDIAWWAAARLPIRPPGVNPSFILNARAGEAEKPCYYRFADNPQEENPRRGYVVSANHQPQPRSGVPVPGYYNLADRARRLNDMLAPDDRKWDMPAAQALQLDPGSGYAKRVLDALLPVLKEVVKDEEGLMYLEPLTKWDGAYPRDSMAATLFTQMLYELAYAAMADEMGEAQFANLLSTRTLDSALPLLAADERSPWWDHNETPGVETRADILKVVWQRTVAHLKKSLGKSLLDWPWGKTHTLTHKHPLGLQPPLHLLFNVGPFSVPGGRETPNNLAYNLAPAPWGVSYGPSTRRVIDFADATKAVGINPVGQSGVLFDPHYDDQAGMFAEGYYVPMRLGAADIKVHTRSTLVLRP